MLLTIYDLSGIQDFIFSSNKLYEMVGASYLVSKALFGNVPEVLGEAGRDWEEREVGELHPEEFGDVPGKVVYIGGGNALVLFKDETAAQSTTFKLQKRIFEQTGGALRLCHASVEIDDESKPLGDYQKEWVSKLIANKGVAVPVSTAMGFALNRLDNTSYEPLLYFDDSEFKAFFSRRDDNDDNLRLRGFATRSAYLKTREYLREYKLQKGEPQHNSYLSRLTESFINADSSQGPQFMVRFEDAFPMPQDDGDDDDDNASGKRYLAIVHLDGNTMGLKIAHFIESLTSQGLDIYSSLAQMRDLSKWINHVYQDALRSMVDEVFPNQGAEIPFRPIICDGDDITFITTSEKALDCIDAFTKALGKGEAPDETLPKKSELKIGIGIAFTPLKFPFSTAYRIAEELCGNAKRAALSRLGEDEQVSSVDFHVCSGELLTDIDTFRKKNYQYTQDGQSYSLVLRPYHFDIAEGDTNELFSYASLRQNLKDFANRQEPGDAVADRQESEAAVRKALMSMREAYTAGMSAAEQQGRYLKARAAVGASKLDEKLAQNFSEPFKAGYARYFDALDIFELVTLGGGE
jgi:hypothetical protein